MYFRPRETYVTYILSSVDVNLQICVFPFEYSQRLRNYLEAMRVGDDIQERVSRLYEMAFKKKIKLE